jgi:hypothetical protein
MAECARRYTSQLGLSEAIVRPLRLLAWMLHSRSEYRRLVADQGRPPDTATLRRSLFVSLWEEELCNRATLSLSI